MALNLVTEERASEMISIPRRTLRYWRSRELGEGPEFVRVGSGRGRIKYDVAVLEDYVDRHRHTFSVRASNGGKMAIYKQPGSSVWSYDSTVDGRRYRGTIKESSKTAALAIEADFRNKAREKGPNFVPLRRSMTLRELSKRFLEWKDTAQLEPKTRRYYEYGWKLLASSSLASLQLTRITTDEVKAVRLVGLLGKPIGGQYANQAIRSLRVMLNKAREWRLIPEVPMLKLRKAAGRQLLLPAKNEAGILKHASEDVQDVFIRIQDPGMRPNEVLQTQWSDVSFNEDLDLCPRVKNGGWPPQGTDCGAPEAAIVGAEEAREIDLGLPKTTRRGPPQVGREELQNARGKAGVDKVLYIARHTFWALCSGGIAEPTGSHEDDGTATVKSTLPYQHHGIEAFVQ